MSSKGLSFAVLVLLSCGVGACVAATSDTGVDEENVESRGRSIIGGSKASAFPEAVLIDMKNGGQITSACSGALIAPKVVLTAGHCVHGFDGWNVKAPYANNQSATSTSSATYDWTNDSEYVNPNQHDIGLIFLSKAITLTTYPTLSASAVADNTKVVNIGRINNGYLSNTNLYVSQPISVKKATSAGFPYDYIATEVIESGDSGGPDLLPGTHTIVAVNSGGGGGTEVLARVDLVYSWIQQQIASHGGSGSSGGGSTGGGSTGGGSAACAHNICASGGKLVSNCDPCVAKICAADSYCCSTSWDAQCVGEVASICNQSTCSAAPPADTCNGVTYAGTCQGNTVVWCENGLKQQNCSALGKTCKYDSANKYYNCL